MNHLLKFWVTILAFLTISLTSKAEWQLATINDPDGFTNVRSGKGITFSTVATVKHNEFFYSEPSSSDWWKVSTINGIEGFVHKSRIQLIESLPDSAKRTLFFSIFKNQQDLAEKFRNAWKSKDSIAYRSAVRKVEDHNDNRYAPLLKPFTAYFCKTRDTALLKQLFLTMWVYSGSADERPSYAVGDAFVCQSDILVQLMKQLPREQNRFIAEAIEWGFFNHFNMSEEEKPKNKEFIQLKRKLATARK